MNIDPVVVDTLVWTGMVLLAYMLTNFYSLLRYNLYRDRTKHPREWPRLNRYFEYYNAYPATYALWLVALIERGVRKIKNYNSIWSF